MKKDMQNELIHIIRGDKLKLVFQPIIDFSLSRIHGYEALIRGPDDSPLHYPTKLFEAAQFFDLVEELEQACLEIACEEFLHKKLQGKLFLNISPFTLILGGYEEAIVRTILEKFKLDPERVVIELSEQYPVEDYDSIRVAITHYREMGLQIAIDDLGSGYSGLRVWSEIKPEYVKIDRHFIHNINEDPVKREFVRSIQEISRSLNCHVIAEGIETRDELSAVGVIGITHGQGFLLGKPVKAPRQKLSPLVSEYYQVAKSYDASFSDTIADLVKYRKPLRPTCKLGEVADIFNKDRKLTSLPVVAKGSPVGIITRQFVSEIFLGRYGRELHARNPIHKYMDIRPLVVQQSSIAHVVSKTLTNRPDIDMNIDFIIVEKDKYIGVGSTRKLLEKVTEQKIKSARYANPLTMLPGNVPIFEWIDESIKSKKDFYVAYCDLNFFKPYNDKYGYSRGDDVIRWLGELIKSYVSERDDRLGHIGGDDFVIVFKSEDWLARCQQILMAFEKQVSYFMSPDDIAANGISSFDRTGKEQFFPILGLAIGVVQPDTEICTSHHDVSAIATDAKHEAKKQGGNALFVSRRRGPAKSSNKTLHLFDAAS